MPSDNVLFEYLEDSPIAVFTFCSDLKIRNANRAFCQLAGREKSAVTGKSLKEALSNDFFENFRKTFEKNIAEPCGITKEEYWSTSDSGKASCYSIMINKGPVYDGVSLFVAFIEDITELKSSEKSLAEARDIAEQATRTKSEFLANVSHEIRTPLHTIMGMSELMLETTLDVEQKEYSDQILFSAGVLLSLVNDILDFSKIEAGKLELENIEFNLYETLEDAVTLIAMEAHKKGLEVILSISPSVPEVITGDPVRLRQIVMNLLNNAIKFTKNGEIVVSADVESTETGSMVIRFQVRDTGIGIPESRKDILFSAFTQADSSVTRKYGGTGLGLSICRKLAHLFGGEIGFESTEGAGSLFWFTIKTGTTVHSRGKLPESITLPEKMEILLVDDNNTGRKQVKSYLEEIGARVYEAASGPDALALLNKCSIAGIEIDLVLADQRMPGMDGWQLASELKADSRFSEIKKILMTPIGMGGDEAKMKLLNWFDSYINKPVKKSHLYSAVFTALDIVVDMEEVKSSSADQELALMRELLSSSRKKFLLAEDYFINQKLFKTILNNLGIDVKVADNGQEAVELAAREEFDLILMDIQMPVMNGFDAARKIREMGIKTPVVAVTANAVAGEKEKCVAAGMNDFLSKPFKKTDLVPLFSKWLISGDEVADLEELEPLPEKKQAPVNIQSCSKPSVKEGKGSVKKLINYGEALGTFMGEKEILAETLSEFSLRLERQLADMEKLLEEGDFETLRREAHSIKGGSWNLSIREFGDAAGALESSSKEKNREDSVKNLGKLAALYPGLRDEIKILLGN